MFDCLTLDKVQTFIQTIGFPVAVAAYVLVRLENTVRSLTSAINDLHATITKHSVS